MAELRLIDPCTPRPYDSPASLKGLGGTEATVMRIARSLAAEVAITIEQQGRTGCENIDGITFAPFDPSRKAGGLILVINAWKVALMQRRANPSARILLWLHIYPGRHNRAMGARLRAARIGVICVSASHARALRRFLPETPEISYIYNPLADDLAPDQTARDPDRLIFASSPHKGLGEVLAHFAQARAAIPSLELVLADPGYMRWPMPALPPGVRRLGALSHAGLIGEFRRALCLFYPQSQFAETFGLVIAEANAVGCPALLHGPTGANAEIAPEAGQCLEEITPQAVVERLSRWRRSPPDLRLRPDFRLSEVRRAWLDLIRAPSSPLPGGAPQPRTTNSLTTSSLDGIPA